MKKKASRCPECGAALAPDAPLGFCPGCLMKAGMESQDQSPDSSETAPVSPQIDADPDDATLLPHPERVGPYRILEVLGQGGMGVVYLAEQREPVRRRVALKVIKLGMDTKEVVVRFEAERQALAMMDHSDIARIYDAGSTEQGRPFFVMEYVPGEPITTYCDRHRLGTKERLELFTRVCDAVQHAHQKAIIHRDIKPSNVLGELQWQVQRVLSQSQLVCRTGRCSANN